MMLTNVIITLFLNEVRKATRLKHMSRRTEVSYLHYVVDFIRFCGKRHPKEIGTEEIPAYLRVWP
jgi:hypothetical protein